MTVAGRLARFFVAPVADVGEEVRWLPPAEPPVSEPVHAASVAVVCAPGEARVAGCATALALAHHTRAPTVLVLEWTGAPRPAADRPAAPAARRLAAAHEGAVAAGRLARVALEPHEPAAAARAHRALQDPSTPAVLVVAGPRGEAMSSLIEQQDRVLVVTPPDAPAELPALAVCDLPATLVVLPRAPGAAALARSGTALAAPLRPLFLEALR